MAVWFIWQVKYPMMTALISLGSHAKSLLISIRHWLWQAPIKNHLLSAQVFIKNLEDFEGFNNAWKEWMAGSTPPVRATIQANLVNPNWLVEIMVTAATQS